MIAQRAVLQINHSTYEILRCYYQFQRDTDAKNRPCSVYYGGSIVVELGFADDNTLFRRMVDKKMTPVSGAIEVFSGVGNRCIRRIAFEHAYVAAYGESTRVGHFAPVTVVVISPMRLDFDQHSLRLDRRWPQAPDGWQRYEEEKAPFAPVADAPPVPLVTAVKGKASAIPHAVVEYRVTGYSLSGISESDKQRVKWQVGVDGKETLQKARGETLKLTIDETWTGKEITVMPYLKTPTETVSVKTKVSKWYLPRVIIQTKTKEGFGNKTDRNVFEYEDSQGKGLTPVSTQIAVDMHYGTGPVHTDNFTVDKIKDAAVRRNIEMLHATYNDEGLFKLFAELIKYTSKGELEKQNLAMVKRMQQRDSSDYRNGVLTEAVFGHGSTMKFVERIKGAFIYSIKKYNGDSNKVDMKEAFDKLDDYPIRPSFSGKLDTLKGLKVALNDTWGFRVTITSYSFDAQAKACQATLKYRIIDHFGLDVDDVVSFGSKEKILQKAGVAGAVLDGITMPRDERGYPLEAQSVASTIAQEAAHGFCAWFILQHLRGYRPFVTLMEKEETIKFNLQ